VALELAAGLAAARPESLRRLKSMFRELEESERRVAYENALLADFQRSGAGLPSGG
jgi:enoyl-CoA hydratase